MNKLMWRTKTRRAKQEFFDKWWARFLNRTIGTLRFRQELRKRWPTAEARNEESGSSIDSALL
jgi:hypothetical protein